MNVDDCSFASTQAVGGPSFWHHAKCLFTVKFYDEVRKKIDSLLAARIRNKYFISQQLDWPSILAFAVAPLTQ